MLDESQIKEYARNIIIPGENQRTAMLKIRYKDGKTKGLLMYITGHSVLNAIDRFLGDEMEQLGVRDTLGEVHVLNNKEIEDMYLVERDSNDGRNI